MNEIEDESVVRTPSGVYSACTLTAVVAILVVGMLVFEADLQLLMFTAFVAVIPLVMRLGYSFAEIEDLAFGAVRQVLGLIMILFSVGLLIGTWAASGTIPTIINAGLSIMSPQYFLVTALLLSSAASLCTGTSWGTMGSVGVALMAVGTGLDIGPSLTAGAVISGAYFGDKLSPLSDSTNLAAAMTRTPLMAHVRNLLWTTVPAFSVTAAIFTVIGLVSDPPSGDETPTVEITRGLADSFELGWVTLLPVVVTLAMLLWQKPAFISIFVGALAAGVVGVLYQDLTVSRTLDILYNGFESTTGVAAIDTLVSGGGLVSMLPLAALFMFAVALSGLLSGSGMVDALVEPVLRRARTPRRLTLLTFPVMVGSLALGAAFSFAAVVTATLFAPAYRQQRLAPRNLARIIEDSGTVYDPFFPWSTGGVFAAGALGVATTSYMPFLFFAFLSTGFSMLYSITGFTIRTIDDVPAAERKFSGYRPDEAAETAADERVRL